MYRNSALLTSAILCLFQFQFIPNAAAYSHLPDPGEYQRMLQIAQLKVNRINALKARGSAEALSTSMIRSVPGRYYQPGDVWDVVACQEKTNLAAMNGEPTKIRYRCTPFHYEVLELEPGADPKIKLRVTQKEEFGLSPIDPAVTAVDLLTNDKFTQSQKTYRFENENTVSASPNGVHTSVSALELFPIDVPDIYTAEQSTPKTLPDLPPELKSIAERAGYSADLSKSQWFEQQDLFGRDIEVLWQRGDLWPAYMKTANGIAFLARNAE